MRRWTSSGLTQEIWRLATELRGDFRPDEIFRIIVAQLVLRQWKIPLENRERIAAMMDKSRAWEDAYLLSNLVDLLDREPFSSGELEFADTWGQAFDAFLGEQLVAAKQQGYTYTPRSVVELMARLADPRPGQSVCDPYAGTAGFLIAAARQVAENFGGEAGPRLYGQEVDSETCAIAKLNLILHDITDASIQHGNTLDAPLHLNDDGTLRTFDRVLTVPPAGMRHDPHSMSHMGRMVYGFPGGRQADFMHVQHVLASLKPDGVGAMAVLPGVLFRGATEAAIRRGIVQDGRLAAVIGIGRNVFYGTNVPACILVLRGSDGPRSGEDEGVLFINADAEAASGRTQYQVKPELTEKIVSVFRTRSDVDGFARVVPISEIADNDFNLTIQRYVDDASSAEVLPDVRATLYGGVPMPEIRRSEPVFRAFGVDTGELFRERDDDYADFLPEDFAATAIRIRELTGPPIRRFYEAFDRWWPEAAARLTELADGGDILGERSTFMDSMREALRSPSLLDGFELDGAFAAWWAVHHDDLRSLAQYGFSGVVHRWEEDGRSGRGKPLVPDTLEGVLDTLGWSLGARLQARVTAKREELIDVFRQWHKRYGTSLTDLEQRRDGQAEALNVRLRSLGYD